MTFPPVPPKTPKKQTRCAISVKGTTYARLKAWHAATGRSISGLLEHLIEIEMRACGIPYQAEPWTNDKPKADEVEAVAAAHFTF